MNAFETYLETNSATAKYFKCFDAYWGDAAEAKSTIQSTVLDAELAVRHGQANDFEQPKSGDSTGP